MLSGNFFTIGTMYMAENSAKVVLELNPDHNIFEGHFPGMPVVPGVCMMQMVHEIMERIAGKLLLLSKADLMKFLVVVDPRVSKIVQVDVSYQLMEDRAMNVNASLSANTVVCFKFKGMFIPVSRQV